MEWILISLLALAVLIFLSGIKVINQYERGVVLTLGVYSYTLGPGLRFVIPIFQRMIRVDLRITTTDIPSQEVITKDNVPMGINAVVYYQVEKPEDAVTQYAQTALRDVISRKDNKGLNIKTSFFSWILRKLIFRTTLFLQKKAF